MEAELRVVLGPAVDHHDLLAVGLGLLEQGVDERGAGALALVLGRTPCGARAITSAWSMWARTRVP